MEISKLRSKGKIPWLGSKFYGQRKTVGPSDHKVTGAGTAT